MGLCVSVKYKNIQHCYEITKGLQMKRAGQWLQELVKVILVERECWLNVGGWVLHC